jgi:hypothetical protein
MVGAASAMNRPHSKLRQPFTLERLKEAFDVAA